MGISKYHSAAREKAGPDVTLFGGLDGPNIGKGTPQEIEAQCLALLTNRQNDPRFVLSTSGPDVAVTTPPENIRAMWQAVAAFRT